MHRLILNGYNNKKKLDIDHKDGNKVNNQKLNLRFCTRRQNNLNSIISYKNTSGYKGVSWFKRDKKWRVYSSNNRIQKHLGYFNNINDAKNAYRNYILSIDKDFYRIK